MNGFRPLSPGLKTVALRFTEWARGGYPIHIGRLTLRRTPWLLAGFLLGCLVFWGWRTRIAMDEKWEIRLFGGPTARRGDTLLNNWRSVRARSLLGYLAIHPRWHDRAQLAEEIWGEGAPAQRAASADAARQLLSQELSRLKKQFSNGVDLILSDNGAVRLNPDLVVTDVGRFEGELDRAAGSDKPAERVSHLEEATRIYRGGGELLPGVNHEWVVSARSRLVARYEAAEDELATLQPDHGATDIAEMRGRVQRAALNYHRMVAARVRQARDTPEEERWMAMLDAERQSVLAAMEFEMQQDRVPKLLGSWEVHMSLSKPGVREQVADWLERRLRTPGFGTNTARPWVYSLLGRTNGEIPGREALAKTQMEEAARLFEAIGRRPEIAGSYVFLAYLDHKLGLRGQWEAATLKAEKIYREDGNVEHAAGLNAGMAQAYLAESQYRKALQRAREAARLYESIHNRARQMRSCQFAAEAAAGLRDFALRDELLRQADGLVRDSELSPTLVIERRAMRGDIAFRSGDLRGTCREYGGTIRFAAKSGRPADAATLLGGFLVLIAGENEQQWARWLGSPANLRTFAVAISSYRNQAEALTNGIPATWQVALQRLEAWIAARLGEVALLRAQREGAALASLQTYGALERAFGS